jgi:putative ATP-dependent endonuclease of OLD family
VERGAFASKPEAGDLVMRMTGFRAQRYRSLHDVELGDMSHFNVLVGRNNAGKSSLLRAIQHVAAVAGGTSVGDAGTFTDQDPTEPLVFTLAFALDDNEREPLLNLAQSRPRWADQLAASPFLRALRVTVQSDGANPNALTVSRTEVTAQDGEWAIVSQLQSDNRQQGLRWESLPDLFRRYNAFSAEALGPRGGAHNQHGQAGAIGQWLRSDRFGRSMASYLRASFFLSPFRHAVDELPVQESAQLLADGSNLSQLLHAIHSNDPERFRRIERTVQSAVPDVGTLITPLRGNSTFVAFLQGKSVIRMKDMGTGVEELLMVAAILETVPDPNLFLEEPEGHLHPGAQRYLMDLLRDRAHQALVATHSPVFLSPSVDTAVFRVALTGRRTSVAPAPDAAGLDAALSEIGSRNSDLLLSDAVLFVEGPSDGTVLRALAGAIGSPLLLSRVTILSLGGTDASISKAKVRSSVLEGISNRTPIPHMFILDRDERSEIELKSLESLGDRVVVLERRELENYLLVPRAIITALKVRFASSADLLAAVEAATSEDISAIIAAASEALYESVLLKRVRAELGGLPEGLLDRESVMILAPDARGSNLTRAIRRRLRQRLDPLTTVAAVDRVVRRTRSALEKEWRRPELRERLAPGADVLGRVFAHFGAVYDKSKDGERIASAMNRDELAPDMAETIRRVAAMAGKH